MNKWKKRKKKKKKKEKSHRLEKIVLHLNFIWLIVNEEKKTHKNSTTKSNP